ncbi:restriction endonuclease subunit S [Winogradskyella eckloniae]|uniref:restriction endonuclease subunit S n=1 Tax=Winogradskyella eckloniae TaxID=1089306 RepID=UPI001564E97C|nr:restriction endonuclease subunit S [Winogradskyella eckloniae]NRD19842.1 restriction endonuclease subunit S [Winogradskyella eckloniae]
MANENKTSSKPSLREPVARNEANSTKQSHKANGNNKQITSAKKPRNDVPKLRFKEFEGEWEKKKLVSKIDFIAGYAFKSFEMKSVDSKYQLLKMSNIYKSELQLDRNPSYWEEIDSKLEKYLLKKKDILLTLTGTVGKRDYGYSIVIPENNRFLLNQRLVCLRAKPNESDADFVNNLIKTSRFYYFFFNESKGGTGNQTNVGIDDLRNIKLLFPNLPEQQKIANFLTAVDTKLQQLTTKKETLEQYKKGVMQQLFSQQLRFKPDVIANAVKQSHEANSKQSVTNEYQTQFPDWEEKRLGEIATKKSSNIAANTIEENIGDYKLYGASGYLKSIDFYREEEAFVSIVKDGAGVGRTLLCEPKSSVLGTLDIISPKIKVNLYFLYSVLNNIRFNKYIIGSTIPHIYFKDYSKEKIEIPCFEEQQKIANYLSAIDKKIEAVQTQISNTQAFKKGLLQQMFV